MFLIPLDTIGDPVIAITRAVLICEDVGIRPLHRIPRTVHPIQMHCPATFETRLPCIMQKGRLSYYLVAILLLSRGQRYEKPGLLSK